MGLSTLLSIAMLVAAVPDSTPPGSVSFACPKQVDTCYYTIYFSAGGQKSFTLSGGQRDSISGVRSDDTYCENDAGQPDEKTCQKNPVPTS